MGHVGTGAVLHPGLPFLLSDLTISGHATLGRHQPLASPQELFISLDVQTHCRFQTRLRGASEGTLRRALAAVPLDRLPEAPDSRESAAGFLFSSKDRAL